MDRLHSKIKQALTSKLGYKPKLCDYQYIDVRKHLNKDGVSVYYKNELLTNIKLR